MSDFQTTPSLAYADLKLSSLDNCSPDKQMEVVQSSNPTLKFKTLRPDSWEKGKKIQKYQFLPLNSNQNSETTVHLPIIILWKKFWYLLTFK